MQNMLYSAISRKETTASLAFVLDHTAARHQRMIRTNDQPHGPEDVSAPEPLALSRVVHIVPGSYTGTATFSIDPYIRDLGDPRVSLLQSLAVSVEYFEDKGCVYCAELDEFVVVNAEEDPLAEMRAAIVDLYFLLKAESRNLGPIPQSKWNTLKTIVQEN